MKASVLIVDDERVFRVLAEEALTSEGFEVRQAQNLAKARAELSRSQPDVVVLDRRLPDGDGMELLREERKGGGDGPLFVVVTAYGDIQNAVDAVQAGAVDYLAKPVQPTDLVMKLRKVLEVRGLRDRLARARSTPTRAAESPSPKMRAVMEGLRRVSQSPLTPVFILGASGSGKQYAAEQLHTMTHGGHADAPFIDVNCAALPANLVESELFGHERGAFTDARSSRRGLIELADGGTLFLDEIGELPEASQAKLLKFLDSMRFRRVGGERELEVSLRVIAATNQDVGAQVKSGRFREDLFHRLSVFVVQVPPLAQRREEVPMLAQAFLEQCARKTKKRVESITPSALGLLQSYEFPGNVRELRNIIERAVILAQSSEITPGDLVLRPPATRPEARHAFFEVELEAGQPPPSMQAVEHAYVLRVLEHHEGRRMAAAQALGISYPTFLKRLRELGIASE